MSGGIRQQTALLRGIVDRVNVGIFVVDRSYTIRLWNRFMELNSGLPAADVVGRNLFAAFPELDEKWLRKKIETVFLVGNYAFTASEQRPYLFRFAHNRPVTGGIDYMQQDCTFLPIEDDAGDVTHVCVSVLDVTDTSIYHARLQTALQSLKEMSMRDGLTGIFNRRHLETALESEVSRVRRYGGELSVVMFDIDEFKRINDTFGHRVGDEVIQSVVRLTRQVLRLSDMAGRYGGEEFTLILPETGTEGAECVAERLRALVANAEVPAGKRSVSVTISAGVSAFRPGVAHHEALLNEADQALYQAKADGRNRVAVFRPASDAGMGAEGGG